VNKILVRSISESAVAGQGTLLSSNRYSFYVKEFPCILVACDYINSNLILIIQARRCKYED